MTDCWCLSVAVHIEKHLIPGFVVFGTAHDQKIKDTIVPFRCQYRFVYTTRLQYSKNIFMVATWKGHHEGTSS